MARKAYATVTLDTLRKQAGVKWPGKSAIYLRLSKAELLTALHTGNLPEGGTHTMKTAACKYCGKDGLMWQRNSVGKWQLIDGVGAIHTCLKSQQAADQGEQVETPLLQDKSESVTPKPAAKPLPMFAEDEEEGPFVDKPTAKAATGIAQALELLLSSTSQAVDADTVRRIVREEMAANPVGVKSISVTLNDKPAINVGTQHKLFPQLLTLVSARLNVLLVGPAGSGKTSAASATAKAMGLDFSFLSVGVDTGAHELIGYYDVNGVYRGTEFRRIFEHGGVFLLDEIDAAQSSVLTVMNAALANGSMAFPDRVVAKSPNCYILAAANTYGNGPDAVYCGRGKMDGATKNRFFVLDWGHDWEFVWQMAEANCEPANKPAARIWHDYVVSCYNAVSSLKFQYVIGPRAVLYAMPLIGKMPPEQIAEGLIWQGMPATQKQQIVSRIGEISQKTGGTR